MVIKSAGTFFLSKSISARRHAFKRYVRSSIIRVCAWVYVSSSPSSMFYLCHLCMPGRKPLLPICNNKIEILGINARIILFGCHLSSPRRKLRSRSKIPSSHTDAAICGNSRGRLRREPSCTVYRVIKILRWMALVIFPRDGAVVSRAVNISQ